VAAVRLIRYLLRGIAGSCGLCHDAGGSAAVELALVAPALFMFVFGIVECGRALWLKNALDYSVAEAARCASINPTVCGSMSDIKIYAAARSGSGVAASAFSWTTPICGNQVSANYPMPLMIPFLTLSVTLTAQACYPS
jgi:hypothetical protein